MIRWLALWALSVAVVTAGILVLPIPAGSEWWRVMIGFWLMGLGYELLRVVIDDISINREGGVMKK